MKIRISQLRQRLDDWQLPPEELAARALHVKREDIRWARLARKSVDARDKSDVHFTLTMDVETARPVRLPKNAEALPAETSPINPKAACESTGAFFAWTNGEKSGNRKAAANGSGTAGDSSRWNQWRGESSREGAAANARGGSPEGDSSRWNQWRGES